MRDCLQKRCYKELLPRVNNGGLSSTSPPHRPWPPPPSTSWSLRLHCTSTPIPALHLLLHLLFFASELVILGVVGKSKSKLLFGSVSASLVLMAEKAACVVKNRSFSIMGGYILCGFGVGVFASAFLVVDD